MSVESLPVALFAFGEGWHNFHHVFPWDYKTSEFGDYKFNMSTGFIDLMAKIGWARDRKYKQKSIVLVFVFCTKRLKIIIFCVSMFLIFR